MNESEGPPLPQAKTAHNRNGGRCEWEQTGANSWRAVILPLTATLWEEQRFRKEAKKELLDELDRRWRQDEWLVLLADSPVAHVAKWIQAQPGVAITLALLLTLCQFTLGFAAGQFVSALTAVRV